MAVDLWMPYIYAHARFDDLDLDAGSHSGSAKFKKNQRCVHSATKQAISIKTCYNGKLLFFFFLFLRDLDLDFANRLYGLSNVVSFLCVNHVVVRFMQQSRSP